MNSIAAIAASGMTAATAALNASASNLANMGDVWAVGGAPGYQPTRTVNSAKPGGGVTATAVTLRPASTLAYDPISPIASVQGMVVAPEIDPIAEISAQMQARQAYASSVMTFKAADEMDRATLDMSA